MNTKKHPKTEKRSIEQMREIRDHLNDTLSKMTPEQRRAYFEKQEVKSVPKS